MDPVLNISPLDGRYKYKTNILEKFFSEYAYIKYRLIVEIEYLIKLKSVVNISIDDEYLRLIYKNLTLNDVLHIKNIEKKINHDVKSIEYFIKEKLSKKNKEYVHFGLTSQDVNNTALSISIRDCLKRVIYNRINKIQNKLDYFYDTWKNIAMIGRTHGQIASPTTIGKELYVFHYRLGIEFDTLKKIKLYTKFGGAVGNLNAHYVAYPDINWIEWCDEFISYLGLYRSKFTTQIDNYDSISRILDSIKRTCVILTDLCQDVWLYISFNYFKLKIRKDEVGSSTMPHKVNPINFENAEGNFKLCISLIQFLSAELPISRLQRDLTDSTLTRNMGSIFGYFLIAIDSLLKGLDKLDINKEVIENDLKSNPVVLSEAIQTVLRREGFSNPYEELKTLTQNKNINEEDIKDFINCLKISDDLKNELLNINVFNYVGKN